MREKNKANTLTSPKKHQDSPRNTKKHQEKPPITCRVSGTSLQWVGVAGILAQHRPMSRTYMKLMEHVTLPALDT